MLRRSVFSAVLLASSSAFAQADGGGVSWGEFFDMLDLADIAGKVAVTGLLVVAIWYADTGVAIAKRLVRKA